jgi:hypothetical protein
MDSEQQENQVSSLNENGDIKAASGNVKTGGGVYVAGNVSTAGNFVGRDHTQIEGNKFEGIKIENIINVSKESPKTKHNFTAIIAWIGAIGGIAAILIGISPWLWEYLAISKAPPIIKTIATTMTPEAKNTQSVISKDQLTANSDPYYTPTPSSTFSPPPTSLLELTIDVPPQNEDAPVITNVDFQRAQTSDGVKIYQYIYYHDRNGDALMVKWALLYSSDKDTWIYDGTIEQSENYQKAGTNLTASWVCSGKRTHSDHRCHY